jgi:hypothetical protein
MDRLVSDVERMARAMHEARICENWSPGYGRLDANGDFHDDHGAAEHFHEARRVVAALTDAPTLTTAEAVNARLGGKP